MESEKLAPKRKRKESHLQQETPGKFMKMKKKVKPWPLETLHVLEHHLGFLQKPLPRQRCDNGQCLAAHCEMVMGPDVELECEAALPHGWEQFLDLQTGQVYYIDWRNCRRSYIDPRKLHHDLNNKGSVLQDLQSEITEQEETSHCGGDADDGVENIELKKDMAEGSKVITYPMLQEDWNMMESRGWGTSIMTIEDHLSEVGSTMSENTKVPECRNYEEKCQSISDAES